MNINILNYSSYFLLAFTFYIAACIADIFIEPTETKLTSIEVHNITDNRVSYTNIMPDPSESHYNIPVPLKPGMIITGVYEVKRFYSAENNLERIISSPSREYTILNSRRTHIPGTTSMVSAEFAIPITIPDGCGYRAYSRNSIVKTYNILTYMRPHISQTTPIQFCIRK